MKKAQSVFTLLFYVLVFIIVMALFGWGFLNMGVTMARDSGNISGIELFIIDNLAAIVIIVFILAIIVFFSMGGGR